MVAEEDKVAAYVTVSGTHQGAFMGMAPTGKRVSYPQVPLMRLADGKMAEHWEARDELAMLRQLGMLPAPGH